MNNDFVIEERYNFGVGFMNLDNTRKLVRHFEFQLSSHPHSYHKVVISLDVYEDGLINCFQNTIDQGNYIYYQEPRIDLLFTINITNEETINIFYLELIDNIYKPFWEKKQHVISYNQIIESTLLQKYRFGMDVGRNTNEVIRGEKELFTHTFQTLEILKKMYDKIVIF